MSDSSFWSSPVGNWTINIAASISYDVAKHVIAKIFSRQRLQPVSSSPTQTPFDTPPPTPLALSKLVGREADFAEVLHQLYENRLVTLVGPGGVGKTTLAQTIALWTWDEGHEPEPDKQRGVPYISLEPLESGWDLADFIFSRLLPSTPLPLIEDLAHRGEYIVRTVASELNLHACLLVLDNFECVLDEDGGHEAINFITRLLASINDQVRILITSRHPLFLQSDLEVIYEIEPLPLEEAIALFYERSKVKESAASEQQIAEICQRVDCLPLGIELAGAAVRQGHRPLSEMAERLRITPFDIEVANMLGYPERQRGLLATYWYTFEYLSVDARRLLCEFSVFRGGASRSAVQEVDGTDSWERALSILLDWQMLLREDRGDTFRYSMLTTTKAFADWVMKEYAQELDLDFGIITANHAHYYLKIVADLVETPLWQWHTVEMEWENIKAGANYGVSLLESSEGKSIDELLKVIDSLPVKYSIDTLPEVEDVVGIPASYALYLRKYILKRIPSDGEKWLAAGAVAAQLLGYNRGKVLIYHALGTWFSQKGVYDAALKWLEKALELGKEESDDEIMAVIMSAIGTISRRIGNYGFAIVMSKKALNLLNNTSNRHLLASVHNNLGIIYEKIGLFDVALKYHRKNIEILESIHEEEDLGHAYNGIGMIYFCIKNYTKARMNYKKSLKIFQEHRDITGTALVKSNMATLSFAQGLIEKARIYAEESLKIYEDLKLENEAKVVRNWMASNLKDNISNTRAQRSRTSKK